MTPHSEDSEKYIMTTYEKSDYGVVGETIQWTCAAGILTGTITKIDRNKETRDPKVNADWYLMKWDALDVYGKPMTKTANLNSFRMTMMEVVNLTRLEDVAGWVL
ncbi:hypothetical protein GD1_196 [Paraglaciecola Antarctic GD virus 1]|nr:hypothetical protein GD1_196 [Paraglaciecola Antarctic GD virus 1]